MNEGLMTENYYLVLLKSTLLDKYLDELKPMLMRSKQRARNAKDLAQMIKDINTEQPGVHLWMCFSTEPETIHGCFVCTYLPTPAGLVYTIEVLTSETGYDWIHETIEPFEDVIYQTWGVVELKIIGPKGWYRVLREHGYEEPVFITSKNLEVAYGGKIENVG